MLGTEEVQAAIVATLKANIDVLALIASTQIKESQYKGTQFTLPGIRVQVMVLAPRPGNCFDTHSDCRFTVTAFSEADSSKGSRQAQSVVVNALIGKRLSSSVLSSSTMFCRSVPGPRRVEDRLWAADSVFECTVIES